MRFPLWLRYIHVLMLQALKSPLLFHRTMVMATINPVQCQQGRRCILVSSTIITVHLKQPKRMPNNRCGDDRYRQPSRDCKRLRSSAYTLLCTYVWMSSECACVREKVKPSRYDHSPRQYYRTPGSTAQIENHPGAERDALISLDELTAFVAASHGPEDSRGWPRPLPKWHLQVKHHVALILHTSPDRCLSLSR